MVLENKLNITNQIELNKMEEKLSKEKAKPLDFISFSLRSPIGC